MTKDCRQDLTSWKEIAAHLQVTVRTAQTWEKKRGLPVRRRSGPRGRVFMRLRELEEWLESGQVGAPAAEPPRQPGSLPQAPSSRQPASARPSLLRPLARAVLGAAALLVLLLLVGWLFPQRRRPAQWQVTREELIVRDDRGDQLWRVRFPQGLRRESYSQDEGRHPKFVDLNGDGRLETLFIERGTEFAASTALICFDDQGHELWRFGLDAEIVSGAEAFENIYRVDIAEPVALSNGGMGVVTVSTHYLYYPVQIALLSGVDGTVMASYWHAGHIGNQPDTVLVTDFNGDGRSEVFATGVSNSYRRATLVVLDVETMSGASDEANPGYQLRGFGPPNEIARILFPKSSMSTRFDRFNAGKHVWTTPGSINVMTAERLYGRVPPALIYQIRPDWTLEQVVASPDFEGLHDQLVQERTLAIGFDEEMERLEPLQYVGRPRALTPRR